MARLIVWHCDNCNRESRTESAGWLVVKEFRQDHPKFYSFCNWRCLAQWLKGKDGMPNTPTTATASIGHQIN